MRTTTEQIKEEVYTIIRDFILEHKYAPTSTSIAQQLGKSRQRIDQHIEILVAEGRLKKPRKNLIILGE